jgi:hypothetical protein
LICKILGSGDSGDATTSAFTSIISISLIRSQPSIAIFALVRLPVAMGFKK